MADDNKLKAQLYRQIVQQTPSELLLQRMQLYGFWPLGEPLPTDPPVEAAERAALTEQITVLRQQQSVIKDPEKALAEERQRRWQASKQRRAEAKAARKAAAEQKRQAWAAQKQASIVHTGSGLSAGLNHTNSDRAALNKHGLPLLDNATALADALDIDLATLRWLTYHRQGAMLVHYHRYGIAKKTGGQRFISAPKPKLAKAQRWILDSILAKLAPEPPAHGFVTGRSIISNATPHTGKAVVINLDLENFFPSITFARVKGVFKSLGYSEQIATLLTLLCTEPPRVPAMLDQQRYYIAIGARILPQGACTSPALSNRVCRKLDRRLAGLAVAFGFSYSRYADDLSFSSDDTQRINQLMGAVRKILTAEGLRENTAKTRVMRRSQRQQVTGLVVNNAHGPTLSRSQRRELRAILHNAARRGLASQNRDNRPNFEAYLRGRVAFACQVEPQRATAWRALLASALAS